jgi:hypothetical protein
METGETMGQQPPPIPGQPTSPGIQTAIPQGKTSGKAITAFILSLAGIFIVPCVIVAIVLGHLARSEIRKQSHIKGKGLATAALVIGYGYLACIVVITIAAVVHLSGLLWDYKKERASIPKIPVAQLSFEDPGLNACVQRAIQRGFFGTPHEYTSDISHMTCDESETAVQNLKGIEQLTELKELKLGYTNLDDLSPLNRLKKLWYLELYNVEFPDTADLNALPASLTDLRMTASTIVDLSGLANQAKLERLELIDCQIEDIFF